MKQLNTTAVEMVAGGSAFSEFQEQMKNDFETNKNYLIQDLNDAFDGLFDTDLGVNVEA